MKIITDIKEKKKTFFKNIFFLQFIILIYTLSTVAAKFAANQEFMSIQFIFIYTIELVILGIYAILWQQIIKKFDITIAYANKAVGLLWSIVWSMLFFGEMVSLKNFIGVIIVIIGTIIVDYHK